jgi:hypothetical protein
MTLGYYRNSDVEPAVLPVRANDTTVLRYAAERVALIKLLDRTGEAGMGGNINFA